MKRLIIASFLISLCNSAHSQSRPVLMDSLSMVHFTEWETYRTYPFSSNGDYIKFIKQSSDSTRHQKIYIVGDTMSAIKSAIIYFEEEDKKWAEKYDYLLNLINEHLANEKKIYKLK